MTCIIETKSGEHSCPRLSKSGVSTMQRGNNGFGETCLTRQEVVCENNLGVDRTRHMSSLTKQDRTLKFSGQVLPKLGLICLLDRTIYGLIF